MHRLPRSRPTGADLDLTQRSSAVEHAALVPHDAEASSLIQRVSSLDEDVRMPPDGPLGRIELEVLRDWIESGAVWPSHWAYRELSKPSLPNLAAETPTDWCRNPIDRFVAARLASVKLPPSPQADRRRLLRRVYYDLLGVPPSTDEFLRFLEDEHSDAYERVVDRLLSSPRYGERWARHWMDLVHFAETHGHDQDRPREHAWPYRDYLVRRLNEDVPYQQFVREQVAGDVTFADDPWAIAGTGFLAAGPWDESSLRDIQEDSLDRLVGQYLDRDEIVTTVMSTFASTSVHCARCHHHKFDPISQDEYYGLQAVFAGIDKANRRYDPDPAVARRRKQLEREQEEIRTWAAEENRKLLDHDIQVEVDAWEETYRKLQSIWRPVTLLNCSSRAGATMTQQPDQSIYVDGELPETDRYTVLAETTLPRVSAIRLDVLPDPRLPNNGPGRQSNGNFHLNQIRIFSVDPAHPESGQAVAITRTLADFNQAGWDVGLAVDNDPRSAWGIYPEVGKHHAAIFQFDVPLTTASNEPLLMRVELEQSHGEGHLIGRFQLTATGDRNPTLDTFLLPDEIERILAMPKASPTLAELPLRTDSQRMQVAAFVIEQRIRTELDQLPESAMVYCGTNRFEADGSFRPAVEPRVVQVLDRGEISKPLRPAKATALSCVDGLPADSFRFDAATEGERRVALADWLSHPKNGLVWRSIANRVWQYHFGEPLVATPNDFGHAGSPPTHPELLDWLAVTLQEQSGSLKALHRLIVTSATYQQSSAYRDQAARIDASNRWLWRMNRKRLDAESFRDSLLAISESLDNRMGGPSDRQFVESPGVHVTPVVNYQDFDVDRRSNYRRSIYRFIFRTVPDPFMEALDCPDASQLAPRRNESLTAVQALATMNDKFVVRQSELLADRIASEFGSPCEQVATLFWRILGRSATSQEQAAVTEYVSRHGLANACRLLFNTNEFMFVD